MNYNNCSLNAIYTQQNLFSFSIYLFLAEQNGMRNEEPLLFNLMLSINLKIILKTLASGQLILMFPTVLDTPRVSVRRTLQKIIRYSARVHLQELFSWWHLMINFGCGTRRTAQKCVRTSLAFLIPIGNQFSFLSSHFIIYLKQLNKNGTAASNVLLKQEILCYWLTFFDN